MYILPITRCVDCEVHKQILATSVWRLSPLKLLLLLMSQWELNKKVNY